MTKYLVLIAYEPGGWANASAEEQQAFHDQHHAFDTAVGAGLLAGQALDGPETATTLRHVNGEPALTDGPFAETAEMIGGFYLVEAADRRQVVEWCKLLPPSYSLEIRECVTIEGYDEEAS
ncbi:YciI family protein [Flexivirga sp. B27]